MIRAELWESHRLGKHISHRTACGSSCGTAYCRQPESVCKMWTEMYEAGNHSALVEDTAQRLARDPRVSAMVGSDYSALRIGVVEGRLTKI